MKLSELLFKMLQEVIVTPQSEHYPKFRYHITNLLESIRNEKELNEAMVCDSCLQIKNVLYTICIKCKTPMDVCIGCLEKTRSRFSNDCVCYKCGGKNENKI